MYAFCCLLICFLSKIYLDHQSVKQLYVRNILFVCVCVGRGGGGGGGAGMPGESCRRNNGHYSEKIRKANRRANLINEENLHIFATKAFLLVLNEFIFSQHGLDINTFQISQ